ncbi:MAG: SURF1 family protein, partial [Gammaproteobacteria bacterium]|nr:SURF1 family protein [Gammaproteobacteria bacterium]
MTKTIKLLFFLPLIVICIILGFWQIDRGQEKLAIYNAFTDKLKSTPIDYKRFKNRPEQFTQTYVKGNYLPNMQFLLDNKVFKKVAGYEVITPLIVNGKIILINRGWVNSNNRQSLPDISIENTDEPITGYVYYYNSNFYDLADDNYVSSWPLLIQNIEIQKISKLLNMDVEPYVVIMNKQQVNS